ncbi:MAG: hmsF [Burkholderia sp.]|nr:hmsF [Burkholderia sp.]
MNIDWLTAIVRIAHFIVAAAIAVWLYMQPALAATARVADVSLRTAVGSNDPPQSFRVLCYHDVRDNLRESFRTWPEPTAIDTSDLIRHFSWLNENGYHPVSLQQIIDAREGRGKLPDRAVLMTFDDGYKSVYTKVFPLLKQFNFPAVIALVGDWIETPPGTQVKFGDSLVLRTEFLNWDEVRTMHASGLVEVASHTHDLHKGIPANPQGNSIPAAIARLYSPHKSTYESDGEYAARINADLRRSADTIQRELGIRPRAVVWPYGAYNLAAARWAVEAGMTVAMNLEPGPNSPADSLQRMRRSLVMHNHRLPELIDALRAPAADAQRPPERVIHVDLDYVFDPDPHKQEANLSALLDRILRLRPTTVYLQAFADPDGDGVADQLYFPSRHLPMRADLFSRVAWQLRTRTGVTVYAWMPVMAFRLSSWHPAADRVVEAMQDTPQAARHGRYPRLSLFDPRVRRTVTDIYEDLGKHAVFAGVLFHDDATLSDDEDASPAALAFYRDQWQLTVTPEALRADSGLRRRWAEKKTAHINQFTVELADVLRRYHPALLTARNLYAPLVLQPESEEWFAQNYASFLELYDFTALMATPYMEGAADPQQWLGNLVAKVKATPGALQKTVFELQSRDWKTNKPVPADTLSAQWRQLRLAGARHLGYYPDDSHNNHPDESLIRQAISVETFPVRR